MNRGLLGILINKNFNYVIRDDLGVWISGKIASYSLEIEVEKKKILIGVVYRPPGARLDEFINGFDGWLRCISSTGFRFLMYR